MAVELHGYRFSVYARIARLTLIEKGVAYDWREVDPFATPVPADYLALHPFGRVPSLIHDGFALYETAAIARYVDEAFPGPRLQPADARRRARMAQIVGVVDSYGYWPLVRQVFSHRVFRPRVGGVPDEEQARAGLAAASKVLAALEMLAEDADWLVGGSLSLADLHLAPMIAYFAMAPEGAALLADSSKLSRWWARIECRPCMIASQPPIPAPSA
jgi:glutathione S-transferase